MKTCKTPGCETQASLAYDFCPDHLHRAYPCSYTGCPNAIAVYNRSGYCYEHRWVPQKLKRMAAAEKRERENQ